jgi:hypothetical protein
MRKTIALLSLLMLTLSSLPLITMGPAAAQKGVTTPVLTSFVISYDTFPVHHPPTYTVDPSTGTGIIDQPGYDSENRWITIHISNQLFEPYYDSDGHVITAFFDARWKIHDSEPWEYRPDYARYTSQPTESTSTAIVLGFKGFNTPSMLPVLDYMSREQLDFQIKASVGYINTDGTFVGKSTDWSETQTFTIPNSDGSMATMDASTQPYQSNTPNPSSLPSQNIGATSTPSVLDFGSIGSVLAVLVVLLTVIAVLLVFVVFYLRRRSVGGSVK